MDIVLDAADYYIFDCFYESYFKSTVLVDKNTLARQFVSLYLITLIGALVLYFSLSTFSYLLIFDKKNEKDPRFLKNQVKREIEVSIRSLPFMAMMTVPWFLLEIRGYSKLYYSAVFDFSEVGYLILSVLLFLAFTDMMIYWIHRFLHHPIMYSRFHKPHHYWIIPTPFASHAFHPIDGYLQSLPYHIFVFLIPMNSVLYLALYIFVNMWTISIHDGFYLLSSHFINSAAHHSIHHEQFHYNYGQYFTFWDKIGNSYKDPSADRKTK